MRALPVLIALFPVPIWAADIALESDVTAVTLYPTGATIVREVPFSVPQGNHHLILTDLPQGTPLASVRVDVQGATMGSVTTRNDFVPPNTVAESPDYTAALAEVERLEAALRGAVAEIDVIRLEVDAAEAQVAFLENLGRGKGVAELDVTALRDLSTMIGQETLAALQRAHTAERRAAEAEFGLRKLREDLEDARQTLNALVPEQTAKAMLAVNVTADSAMEGTMTVTYNTNAAGWAPVYDVSLERQSGQMQITRGAFVSQFTGENWQDANLTLSTVRPSGRTTPGTLWPRLISMYDPEKPSVAREEDFAARAPAPVSADEAEFAGAARVQAIADFDGLSVTYSYPEPISVASGADRVRLNLGKISAEVDVTAHAVPRLDSTAFLVAEFNNDTGEILLPSNEASFYLDGKYVGRQKLELIANGASADLSFGPIEGLRLEHVVLNRNEGDRGVISKSNEFTEATQLKIENLTDEAWPIRLIGQIPYSEQEDLEISWKTSVEPSDTRVHDKQGIIAWEFELGANDTRDIALSYKIEWPDGMELR